jgi:hypothetical protein
VGWCRQPWGGMTGQQVVAGSGQCELLRLQQVVAVQRAMMYLLQVSKLG